MEDTAENKPILDLEVHEDGSLSIGGGDYTIDKNNMLHHPDVEGMPHVRLLDLFKHKKSVLFLTDSLFVFSISEDDYDSDEDEDADNDIDSEKENVAVTVAIGYLGAPQEWPFNLDRGKYYQLAEKCAHDYHQSHVDDDDAFDIYVDCANSFINAHITSVYFDEAFDKGLDFIDTVLQPINEIEKLIAQKSTENEGEPSNPDHSQV